MKTKRLLTALLAAILISTTALTGCTSSADKKVSSTISVASSSALPESSDVEAGAEVIVPTRLQDDFYAAINKDWLESTEIPSDSPVISTGSQTQEIVVKQIREDMDKMLKERPSDISAELSTFLDLYEMMKDTEQRNQEGFSNLHAYLKKIESIQTLTDFNEKLSEFVLHNVPMPFTLSVFGNMENSEVNTLYLNSPEAILPNTYYGTEMGDSLLPEYKKMLTKFLVALEYTEADATKIAEDSLAFDAVIAPLMKTPEEASVMTAMYNPVSFAEFSAENKMVDFPALIKELTGQNPETISLVNPKYFAELSKIFTEENLPMIKNWMISSEALAYGRYLPSDFQEITNEYNKLLGGTSEITPEDERIYTSTSSLFSQPIGLYYGQTYFGEEAKADIEGMVDELIGAFRGRLKAADWLSDETKAKANLKLDNLYVGIGYPDKIDPLYSQIKITKYADGGSIFENLQEYTRVVMSAQFKQLDQSVDRKKWPVSADTVDAVAVPMQNSIYFPSGILQAPFYSKDQTKSQNYGGVGVVIAHEISHVFDSNGSMYDEKGNINNWWTDEDKAAFEGKVSALITQFDGLPYGDSTVNGTLTVTENTGDLGGMACALEVVNGLNDKNHKEFFTSWAQVWALKASPEVIPMLLADVHSPTIYRVNTIVSNFEEFHQAFDIQKADKMYREESERITIW